MWIADLENPNLKSQMTIFSLAYGIWEEANYQSMITVIWGSISNTTVFYVPWEIAMIIKV